MGIDALDIVFRLEKQFGVKFNHGAELYDLPKTKAERKEWDITAGQLHENVCASLRRQNLPVPEDSWQRVRNAIAGTLVMKPQDIQPGHRLLRDLHIS